MGFWIFMFICNAFIPATMIIAGRMMWKRTPHKINSIVGYRTSMSMKNMDTWKFAHEYCGKLWWKNGWKLLAASVIVQIPLLWCSVDVIGIAGGIICMIQLAVLVICIGPVETALKKKFDENGNRR